MSGFTPSDAKAFLESREHLLLGASTAMRDVVARLRTKAGDEEHEEEATFLVAASDGDRDDLVSAGARIITAIEMIDKAKRLADRLLANTTGEAA